jgi:asparagine synthase (glutamine-hydrolysing)
MCGIFILSAPIEVVQENLENIKEAFETINSRGPDSSNLLFIEKDDCCLVLGFKRLAINDVSDKGQQPFFLNNTYTMCNGEIYNYHQLTESFPLKSTSDCEVLPHLIHKYGFEETVKKLDGVYAICHVDKNNKIHLVRDRVGVKPLFYGVEKNMFVVASESKVIEKLNLFTESKELFPSTIITYNNYLSFYLQPSPLLRLPLNEVNIKEMCTNLRLLLVQSVKKRLQCDREIGCLLSGGLDSSIIACILASELKTKLHTFSVGFQGSTDIEYARKVAKYIGSEHHELILDQNYALQSIERIIKTIETYDTTTIRASTPMFLLCEWISKNFPHKVIFSGEGSDELFCGYRYFHNAPSALHAHNESLRLVKELHKYDVLRAERCTSDNGLELREPFLDCELIKYVTNIPGNLKIPYSVSGNKVEKYFLRLAFENNLPEEVLWRKKEAFSDAVSNTDKDNRDDLWFRKIQNYIQQTYNCTEKEYYREMFNKHFKKYKPMIPEWLPKWSGNIQDPSATVLE